MSSTQETFDALLAWLAADRDVAARKYETIRASLIRIFVAKGFSDAEDLADETITRVIRRLPEIRNNYVGEPSNYFHGVARYVAKEAGRRKETASDITPVASIVIAPDSDEYECLVRCLRFLKPAKRELVLDYHLYDGHDKVEHHKLMAEELGISVGALRGRAHQIRVRLETCVIQCVQRLSEKQRCLSES